MGQNPEVGKSTAHMFIYPREQSILTGSKLMSECINMCDSNTIWSGNVLLVYLV